MLDDSENDAGALVAVEVRQERDAQDDGSLKCSGTMPGDHDKNHDHARRNDQPPHAPTQQKLRKV